MRARVERAGDTYEIDAEELVAGDVVLLEAGDRIPADVRLLSTTDCEVDESLLTGESLAVVKRADSVCAAEDALVERINMGFSGTLITRGRAVAVVTATATGTATEVGRIALALARPRLAKPPLVVRMEQFTLRVAGLVALAIAIMTALALARGTALADILFAALALAVSAVPEGLPVALTIALAVSMRAMSRRHVIVRRLPAVESLGSCTFIASDKTGTLTVNELTVQCLWLPADDTRTVSGAGMTPSGEIAGPCDDRVRRLCAAAVMANEGFLGRRDGGWVHHGDAVDVALLVMAHKANIVRGEMLADAEHIASIPFASERMFAASLHARDGARRRATGRGQRCGRGDPRPLGGDVDGRR